MIATRSSSVITQVYNMTANIPHIGDEPFKKIVKKIMGGRDKLSWTGQAIIVVYQLVGNNVVRVLHHMYPFILCPLTIV